MTDCNPRIKKISAEAITPLAPLPEPVGTPSVHLDALRGLAAFSVMISHWRDLFFVDYPDFYSHNLFVKAGFLITGLGHQWVIVFFVLSGYLVGGSVIRAVRDDRWSWNGYLLIRFTRLYVVLLPALLLGGTADWIGTHLPGTDAIYSGHAGLHEFSSDVRPAMTLPTMAANALFLQTISLPGMHGKAIPTFGSNGPLWSLANEFWYYIAFPLIVLALTRRRRAAGSWSVHCLYAGALIAWGFFVGLPILLMGITWLIGVLIVFFPLVPMRSPTAQSLALGVTLLVFAGALFLHKARPTLPVAIVLALCVALVIWMTLDLAHGPLPRLYVRLARWTSQSSYTLYLVHLPLLVLLKAALHLPRATDFSASLWLQAGAVLIATLAYSTLVYFAFERNTVRVRRWIQARLNGRSQGAAAV